MSPYDPNLRHRRTVRLRDYDYVSTGWYYPLFAANNPQILRIINRKICGLLK